MGMTSYFSVWRPLLYKRPNRIYNVSLRKKKSDCFIYSIFPNRLSSFVSRMYWSLSQHHYKHRQDNSYHGFKRFSVVVQMYVCGLFLLNVTKYCPKFQYINM